MAEASVGQGCRWRTLMDLFFSRAIELEMTTPEGEDTERLLYLVRITPLDRAVLRFYVLYKFRR